MFENQRSNNEWFTQKLYARISARHIEEIQRWIQETEEAISILIP